jgi:tetratricopeptide (TPR) repeat protein
MADTSTNSWKLLYESGRQALQDKKLQVAEQQFSAALQLAEDFAPGDPRLVATLNALARIYSLQRRYLAAAALLNRLLEVTERTLGTSHVQVAGVLTNLAEMYTHLGAAREELELRERVLSIRGDDPNADAASLQRLRDRVTELRTILASQEPEPEPDVEEIELQESLPVVHTSEYSAAVELTREPEVIAHDEPVEVAEPIVEAQPVVAAAPIAQAETFTASKDSAEPEPAVDEPVNYDGDPRPGPAYSPVEVIAVAEQPVMSYGSGMDHGFSDMGRDELRMAVARKFSSRSSIYSIAAGVVLVAGLLAARDYVKSPDDASVSTGSVSLAAATPSKSVVAPVVATPTTPAVAPAQTPDPRTVERLLADRRAELDARRANEERDSHRAADTTRPVISTPRMPSVDLDKTLRSVDAATKAIDSRTRAAADSASALRVQAPTFKKVKIADQP